MSKLKFYTIFSILNILLTLYITICILGAVILMFCKLFYTPDLLVFTGLIIYTVCVILKLRLPKMLINWSDKHKNSLINKFVEFIHNNPQQKKFILPLSFCFDLPFILYLINIVHKVGILFHMFLTYFIFYAGGVLFFYLILYRELGIKDGKIETFF